ncbi:MAG: hypothetical protein VX938_04290 [Myxococcota bacterium]|nr:hypothetical protein [Myxococcota bacterium]
MSHKVRGDARAFIILLVLALSLSACGPDDPAPGFVPVPQCEVVEECDSVQEKYGYHDNCIESECVEGLCVFTPKNESEAVCDDGTDCTFDDLCSSGRCKGSYVDCEDGDLCTKDECDNETGECFHTIQPTAFCDDGISCTHPDVCSFEGACVGKPTETCPCEEDVDCEGVELPPCVGAARCEAYACVPIPEVKFVCPVDDDWTCGYAVCVEEEGGCVLLPRNEGVECVAEGNPCVDEGACEAGACVGPTISCDDGDPCFQDGCDPKVPGGCIHLPLAGPVCDDDDPCTSGDVCESDGTCLGLQSACNDANPCTKDLCDSTDVTCTHIFVEDGVSCDDGDPCSQGDICLGGVCAGELQPCDDGDPCTLDGCGIVDGVTACTHDPYEGPCDDGNPCTEGDLCVSGTCESGVAVCQCQQDSDCEVYEEEDPCLGPLICKTDVTPFVCGADPSANIGCPEPSNPCEMAACSAATGVCSLIQVPDGTACESQDPCMLDGFCDGGYCKGALVACEDGDPCTSNHCQDGLCVTGDLTTGASFVDVNFDTGLPATWDASTDNPNVLWTVSEDYDPQNHGVVMVATGTDGSYDHGATEASLSTPHMLIHGEEVLLRFQTMAQVQDNGCDLDVLTVSVVAYGAVTPVTTICQSMGAWTDIEVDLSAYRNQTVQVRFTFSADENANAGFGFAVDAVELVGIFSCNDEEVCTTGDLCSEGSCVGVQQDPCP